MSREFLQALFPMGSPNGLIELRSIRDGIVGQDWLNYKYGFDEVLDSAQDHVPGTDVYFGALPRTKRAGDGSAIEDYTHVLWGDWDPKVLSKPGLFAAITGLSPKPQIVVDSGSGYHCYWLLDRSYPFAEAQTVMRDIASATGGDHVADKARILRLPGTPNYKTNPPKPVRLLRLDLLAPKHRLSDFYNYADGQFTSTNGGMTFEDLYGPRPTTNSIGWTPSTEVAPKLGPGQRNNGLARLAGIMVAKGLNRDEVLAALFSENDIRCTPPLGTEEVMAIANSMERYR